MEKIYTTCNLKFDDGSEVTATFAEDLGYNAVILKMNALIESMGQVAGTVNGFTSEYRTVYLSGGGDSNG